MENLVDTPELTDQESVELHYALTDMEEQIATQMLDMELLAEQSDDHLQRAYAKQIEVLQTLQQKVKKAGALDGTDLSLHMVSLHEEVYSQLGKVERRTQYLVSR